MFLIWLGLAGFFAFIAFRSFTTGSYFRGGFASFAVLLFVGAIWISIQPRAAQASTQGESTAQFSSDSFDAS